MPQTPFWIVSTLPHEGENVSEKFNHEQFVQLLDAQMLAWSLASGVFVKSGDPRSWRIDALPPLPSPPATAPTVALHTNTTAFDLINHLQSFIYNPLQLRGDETQPRIAGQIDATQLIVAVVGDARDAHTHQSLPLLGTLIRRRAAQNLFGGTTIKPVAVIYLPQNVNTSAERGEIAAFLSDLHTLMSVPQAGERPFETVIFIQDNNSSHANPEGYSALTQQQAIELVAQTLFHMMIGGCPPLDCGHPPPQNYTYFSVGSAALYYDWREHRQRLAKEAGKTLLEKFTAASASPFVDKKQADATAAPIVEQLDITTLFKKFALDGNRPSFAFESRIWEEPKDRSGHVITPRFAKMWRWLSPDLLNIYFLQHLRFLPFRLAEYARLFLMTRFDVFQTYLRGRREALWQGAGDESGLQRLVRAAVGDALKGEYGGARSLRQAEIVLQKIHDAANFTKIDDVLQSQEDFRKLEVFAVPTELQEFYAKANPQLTSIEERTLLDQLSDVLRSHPLPAALFLRAVLVAVMTAFLGVRLLDALSPRVINLEWLLRFPTLVIVILFLIPILIAVWRYFVFTLNPLKRWLRTYIAAVLRHAQERAKQQIKNEMHRLGNQVRDECDAMQKRVAELRSHLAYSEIESRSYKSTTFHRSLLDEIETPQREDALKILSAAPPDYAVDVNGQPTFFADFQDVHFQSLLNTWLDGSVAGDVKTVCRTCAGSIADQIDEAALQRVSETLRLYAEGLYARTQAMSLDGWLQREDARDRAAVFNHLRRLAAPPVVFHSGATHRPIVVEWKYDETDELFELIAGNDGEVQSIEDGGVLSLAVFEPITALNNIAVIDAMGTDTEARETEQELCHAARIAILALTNEAAVVTSEPLQMISVLAGTTFKVSDVCRQQISELRVKLGFATAPTTTRPNF